MSEIKDVAWFYSSLAQASAAIVGLMGAVLGSRLVAYRTAVASDRQWIIRRTWDTERFLRRLRREATTPGVPPAIATAIPTFAGPLSEAEVFSAADQWIQLIEKLPGIASNHRDGVQELNRLAREVTHFKSGVAPWRFLPEMTVLAWLAIFGVIWPLAVLPGFDQALYSKPWMLSAFSLGMVGLFAYYFVQLLEIRSLRALEWPKEEDIL